MADRDQLARDLIGCFPVLDKSDRTDAEATDGPTTVADLYPTKTRLELLRAVWNADVVEGVDDDHTYLTGVGEQPRKVCARIKELEAAGWVYLPNEGVGPFWELTDAGRKVLEGAGR